MPLTLGIRMTMTPGWHVYWRNPGDSGLPPEMSLRLSPRFTAGAFQWPTPERIPVQHLMNYGYEGETVLLVPIGVPKDLGSDGSATLGGTLSYIVCEEVGIPGSAELKLTFRGPQAGGGECGSVFSLWRDGARQRRAPGSARR